MVTGRSITVEVQRTAPSCVAFIPMVGPYAQIPQTFGRLYGWIAGHGLTPGGMPSGVYFSDPAQGQEAARWELRAPLAADRSDAPVDDAGCGIKHVPAHLVAVTIHRGPYEEVGPVYAELAAWVRANGYAFDGPPEEIYFSEPGTPPDETVTELRIPVAKEARA